MTLPTITTPPPAPSRNDPVNFPPRADAQVAYLATLVSNINALVAAINAYGDAFPLSIPAGTAGLPGVSFAGDADTGLFRPAANQLAFAEGGVDMGRIYGRKNILGTVEMAPGGVPNRALIERGSNANGEYVRFADGTQICTYSAVGAAGPITTAEGAIWRSTEYSWTFPASFTATGNLAVNGSLRTGAAAWNKVRVTGISSASVMLFAANSNVNNFTVDFSAIGRWY
ncbi:hypothetical protein EOW65_15120 [Sinirhodobacter ferrireducens]|uniref:DUF2793 domain-containing protein n=1 Tax=Paenirhodobacter ferrireducens TaxID=1215032 RepID=A0A443L9P5_9RHOB|nr:hypothetical protein [Sinirhodobacter ferrireducens]RWR45873.1 hypothetical protein EOW65_15120 [Sinirhodobacter ferrireducens]